MTKIQQWQKLKRDREIAESWQDLPNGRTYQNDTMRISIDHCKPPKLIRAGQQCAGGQNYWSSGEPMNEAVLEYIVKNWVKIGPEVIDIMKEKEKKALQDCQETVSEMQNLIDQATTQSK